MENLETSKVVSLPNARRDLTLVEIMKQEPEIRGFMKYVQRYNLRVKALELIEKKLYLPN